MKIIFTILLTIFLTDLAQAGESCQQQGQDLIAAKSYVALIKRRPEIDGLEVAKAYLTYKKIRTEYLQCVEDNK